MRKLGIATIALLAFGSTAYAIGGGPYQPAPTQPDLRTQQTEEFRPAPYSGGAAPYGDYSADLGMTTPRHMGRRQVRHWAHSSAQ